MKNVNCLSDIVIKLTCAPYLMCYFQYIPLFSATCVYMTGCRGDVPFAPCLSSERTTNGTVRAR